MMEDCMIVGLLLLAATPTAEAQDAVQPDRVICRFEKQLSSRIPVRRCQTAAKWEQDARDTREDLRQAGNKRRSGDPRAND
jgi:hypothetical protein